MIVVRLIGGLGNQMFQYAFGRQVSILLNTPLYLDTSTLKGNADITRREYELNAFDTTIDIASSDVMSKFESIRKSSLKSRLQKISPSLFPYFTVNEPGNTFHPDVFKSHVNTLFAGYWQSEKYFKNIEGTIRKEFRFKPLQKPADIALAERISSCNSVSVHFRRGDYVGGNYHSVCSPEYYKSAVGIIKAKVSNVQLFVISDDINWVKQNLPFSTDSVTYIENHSGPENYIDMQLMSICRYNIIANSSFSWWGAWLNNYQGKVVVAPQDWFTDKNINTNDLIPEGWVRV